MARVTIATQRGAPGLLRSENQAAKPPRHKINNQCRQDHDNNPMAIIATVPNTRDEAYQRTRPV